jgi:hypothetical protein
MTDAVHAQVQLTNGTAEVTLTPETHLIATIQNIQGIITHDGERYAHIFPGEYLVTARYNGDWLYTNAEGAAFVVVLPTCPIIDIPIKS